MTLNNTVSPSIESPVLVLNQNYQPLNICTARRAMILMWRGKAEIIVEGDFQLHSSSNDYPMPSVVRLIYMVKKPLVNRRLSRQALFYRDNFTCQYCGKSTKNLTIDHIIPRSKGGKHKWDNVVSACVSCNHQKAEKLLEDCKMQLISIPTEPKPNPYYMFYHRKLEDEWMPFIPWRSAS